MKADDRIASRVFLGLVVFWAVAVAIVFLTTEARPAGLHPPFPSPDGGVRQVDAGWSGIGEDGRIRSGDSW